MTKSELHYAAGLLEGEGCFGAAHRKNCLRNEVAFSIRAVMTDREPLEKLKTFFGGNLYGPYTPPSHKSHWKPKFVWALQNRKQCIKLATKLWPLLSPRRQTQIDEMVNYYALLTLAKTTTQRTKTWDS